MNSNFAGPPIMKDKIKAAIRKMKQAKNKPNSISVEFLEELF